jgi:hypothetical protein
MTNGANPALWWGILDVFVAQLFIRAVAGRRRFHVGGGRELDRVKGGVVLEVLA